MGISVEFNPELALRNYSYFESGEREEAECMPKDLEVGRVYNFLKKDQRLYWLSDDPNWGGGQVPLVKTGGDQNTSRPIGSAKILEVTHFLRDSQVWTKGRYEVIDLFNEDDPTVHFESLRRIN